MNEREWIEFFRENLPLDEFEVHCGVAADNMTLPVPNCGVALQFGDLRIETENRTIVIEVESAGTVHNFIKYWPYLSGQTATRPEKAFVLIHVYGPSYPAHKALWWFFRGRMPSLIVPADFHLFEKGDEQQDLILALVRGLLPAPDQ